MDRLIRDILNRAWNIMDATNKEVGRLENVGREEGESGWVNDALRHRQPSCVHSGPDRCPQQPWPYHEESGHWVEQFWSTGYPINAPQWPHRVRVGPTWFHMVGKKPLVKQTFLSITIVSLCLDKHLFAFSRYIQLNISNWYF